MDKFTDDEKIIARNINKKYKWIARDKNGNLVVFSHKPYKDPTADYWNSCQPTCSVSAFNEMFESITWEDKEPTLIKDIYDPQILSETFKMEIECAEDYINNVPTIDSAPVVHAHWILEPEDTAYENVWTCSNCGEEFIQHRKPKYRFCPNCGARMDEEEKQ